MVDSAFFRSTFRVFCWWLAVTGPLVLLAQNPTSMESWQYPTSTHYLTLPDGKKIAYVDEGVGDTVVLMVHGLGSYLPAWQLLWPKVRERYRCVAIDLPGYGKSSKDAAWPYTMRFFAQTIHDFIRAMGWKQVVYLGHSMGGQIGLTLALEHPAVIKQLVLLAPAGLETFTETEKAWFAQVMTPEVVKATTEAQIEKNFALNFYGNILPASARFMYTDRLALRATSDYEQYCEMIPRCVQGMLNAPVAARLGEITQPTLVLYGKNDLLIPNRLLHPQLSPEAVAEIGRRIPGAIIQGLEPCGHFVQWDCAEAVAAAIVAFLNP